MLSERTIINGLVLLAGMILGPYLITLTFELNQVALLSFACIVALFLVFFFIKDKISIGPFIAGYFGGALNFLPFGLTLVELSSLLVILYYMIHHVALKRSSPGRGPLYILIPMLIIGAIVLYHDHQFGLRALGGSQMGSRPGLEILVAIMAYLCGINIPCRSASFFSRLPWWCLLTTLVGSVPFMLTTYFPSMAPYVYYVSGNVNLSAYIASTSGGGVDDTGRNGAFLGVATTLQSVLIAYFPLTTWWRPSRWPLAAMSLLCLYGVLLSGFRNSLFTFTLIIILSTICYVGWRVVLMLPLFIIIPLALLFVQSSHIGGFTFPSTVQRTLSFIPGDWDLEVRQSAENSNDFRADISRVYIHEYLRKSPLIGNGFAFDPKEPEAYQDLTHIGSASDHSYYESKAFIVSKNFHVGWISLYDAVGLIGGAAFIALTLGLIGMVGRLIFQRGADIHSPLFPIKVWIFSCLVTAAVGYFVTFGSFNQSFISMAMTGIVLVHLSQIERRQPLGTVTPSPQITLNTPDKRQEFSSAH